MLLVRVLTLEPDQWRYLGIVRVLTAETESDLCILGDKEYSRILALKKPPPDLDPDVIMLARSLVAGLKIPLIGRIKQVFPRAHVLVHGYDAHTGRIGEYLAAGATGYFVLSSAPEDLVRAVRHVAQGLLWGPAAAVELMVHRFRRGEDSLKSHVLTPPITGHELALLKFLNEGLTNKEIACTLGVAEVTVKSQLTKLYRRFNIKTRLQLLSYAMKHDLIVGEGSGSTLVV